MLIPYLICSTLDVMHAFCVLFFDPDRFGYKGEPKLRPSQISSLRRWIAIFSFLQSGGPILMDCYFWIITNGLTLL